jgi:epoxyqueuosine reductase
MLERVRAALAEEGLHIVLPVSQEGLDRAGISLSLSDLLPGGRTGLVIADGGGEFFARFRCSDGWGGADPLDHYTRQVLTAALARATGGASGSFAVHFPFSGEAPRLPIQRLGQAAGLPRPGPLALQIHPRFGPWWAYRAFAVVPWLASDEPALRSPCEGCPAPCVTACPGRAVAVAGFDLDRCAGQRLAQAECAHACAARSACPVGAPERYPDHQVRFHMTASFRHLRPTGSGSG